MGLQLLPTTTITTAGTIEGPEVLLRGGAKELTAIGDFVYGSGGTTAKVFVQTKIGNTFTDIMSFAFALTSAKKISMVHEQSPMATPAIAPTDGSLADNTIVQGLLGLLVRVKVITTGTYAGGTTITVDGNN